MKKNIGVLCFCLLLASAYGHQNHVNNHQQQQQPSQPNAHQQPDLKKQHNNFFEKQDIEHIKHDLKDQYHVEVDEKTNSKEMEYYNFKLHDYDNNGYLDGLELLVALNHNADHVPEKSETAPPEPSAQQRDTKHQEQSQSKFESDALVIDQVLKDYDSNHDGLISYYEYMQVKEKYMWERRH